MVSTEQDAWVARVLGVSSAGDNLPPGKPEPSKRPAPLLPIWIDASQKVNAAIEALRVALLADGDPDLRDIAEIGLNDILDAEAEPVMAALRAVDAAPRSTRARSLASQAAASFRQYLDSDEVVELIEDNPLRVQVPLRRVLTAALDTIGDRLAD